MAKYIMAMDAGTTSNRCILFDKEGNVCSIAGKEFTQYFPKAGWVEHDGDEIWSSMLGVTVEAMSKIGAEAKDIGGIGITNQRETILVWNKQTGEPIHKGIVWQCRRTAKYCDALREKGYEQQILEKTGLKIDAYFSASKIRWILQEVPQAREMAKAGNLLCGTIDTWLIWKLTKGRVHITDYSNASRTMLFNIHELKWDEELLELFEIPASMLPKAMPSSQIYGYVDASYLGGEIPIGGVAGDQQSALFGQRCFEKGQGKHTYGTGGFLLLNTGEEPVYSNHNLVTTIAWGLENKVWYALEGSVFVAGAAIQWLRDELQLFSDAKESEELAKRVADTNGCYIVPAFTGLGAPYWNPYARGTIVGLTRGVNRYHLIRATLESLAYQTYDVLEGMESDCGEVLSTLKVDGGASLNEFLLQIQADVLQKEVERPECIETTALGAAYLAGLAVGFWKNQEEILKRATLNKTFSPKRTKEEQEKGIKEWRRAVRCALAWAKEEVDEGSESAMHRL